MIKRIYSASIKKWALGAGISGGTLIGLIFMYLFSVGAISNVSYSGDSICAGTESDPCYAFINFTANEDIFIYPTDYDPWGRDTLFNFDPNVKSWKLERSWGSGWRNIPLDKSCTGTWCGLSNSKDTRKFAIAFREGKDYQIRITGYKNNPSEDIKWGAFSGVDEIDPTWYGVSGFQIIGIEEPSGNVSGDYAYVEYNISTSEGLSAINWTFNDTSLSILEGLKGYCNMDNRSSLGEEEDRMHCWNLESGFNVTPSGDALPTTAGYYDGGMALDGGGDYLNLGDLNSRYGFENNPAQNSFTLATWVWFGDTDGNQGIFDASYNWNYQGFKYTYETDWLACYSRYGSCGSYSITMNPSTWYHVVVVKNDTIMSSYLNGVHKTTTSGNLSNMTMSGSLLLGRTDYGNYINGTFDEFIYYNRSLNGDEILKLYNRGALTKSNQTNYNFYTNQSFTFPTTYQFCASNSTGSEVCADAQLITNETDTCTYTSGNWDVNFIDNCSITEAVNLGGNNLSLFGDVGRFDIRAAIINFDKIIKYGDADINIYSGGSLNT